MKCSFIYLLITLTLCSGCGREIESQKVKLSCAQLQEKVTNLKVEHGTWSKIPKETRDHLDTLISDGECLILGDSDSIQFSTFNFSVKK